MAGKKKYGGALAKPVDIEFPARPNLLIAGHGAEEAYRQKIREIDALMASEREKRWRLLKEFHDMPDEFSWEDIATTLAVFHVPGMRFRKHVRVGAKQKWTAVALRQLRQKVDETRSRTGKDLMTVLKDVAVEIGFAGKLTTLRTRYYGDRKPSKTVRK